MASQKPQLTDEEKIARKAKLFRLISRVLTVVAVIIIAVFIYFARGTSQNISQQTDINTQELRSKLKQIISLENRYFDQNGEYIGFNFLQRVIEMPTYDPAVDGNFQYKFDPETGIATGRERDSSHDINGDNDGNDGLTLSIDWEPDVLEGTSGGNFSWPDTDKQDFEARRAE